MRSPEALVPVDRVLAAQGGDREALQRLIADHLTMLYNVAGRALGGHADVDDVVQETLLRVVENISAVREPARFSGWLLAILHRQIAERMRRRQVAMTRVRPLEPDLDVADLDADFTGATILRLGLSGQRRQVVEAERWLDPDDRFLLSLWWLEVAGTIERADLVAAIDATAGHAAVRLKRMRDQLELARCIVAALAGTPRCADLDDVVRDWDGVPGSVWRKRIGRHLRDCRICPAYGSGLAPPEALLAGLAMVPLPPALAVSSATTTAAVTVAPWLGAGALAKIGLTVAVVAAGAGIAAVHYGKPSSPQATPIISTTPAISVTSRPPTPPSSPAPSVSFAAARYGSVVDTADSAPPKDRRPGRLPDRPVGTLTVVASSDEDPRPEVVSLIRRGQSATYRGRGYLRIEWAVAFTQRTGVVTMPAWTGLRGKLFHVASGGGRRLDDTLPGGGTGMGDSVLPAGAQQPWHFEYYYLDGQVTFTSNERGADYNLYLHTVTRADIDADLGTGTPVRYGLVRDDGTDATPVPQYLTRATPDDTGGVAQRTRVTETR